MFSRKILISTLCLGLVGCVTTSDKTVENATAIQEISRTNDESTKHAVLSYGFSGKELGKYNQVIEEHDYSNTESFNETSEQKAKEKAKEKKVVEPTKFRVVAFVADNDDCRINYVSTKDGRTSMEVANSSFDAYLKDGVLYTIDCLGSNSNIDYKLNITADSGEKYIKKGSYSYHESTLKKSWYA